MLIIPLAGGRWHSLFQARDGLVQGIRLRLCREDNYHDPHCVAVYLTLDDLIAAELQIPSELEGDPRTRFKLGYVPQHTTRPCWSALVGPALDRGDVIDAFYEDCAAGEVRIRLEGEAADAIKAEGERLEAERLEKHRQWLEDCDVRYTSEQIWGRDPPRRGYDRSCHSFEMSLQARRYRRIEDVKIACGLHAKRERDRLRRQMKRYKRMIDESVDFCGQALLSAELTSGEAEVVKRLLEIHRKAQREFESVVPERPTRKKPRKRNERGYFEGDPADPGPPAWDDDEIPF